MAPTASERRFTANTAAARLLQSKFLAGQLTGNKIPAIVRESEELFKQYDVKSFDEKFRKYSREYGMFSRLLC